MFLSSPWNGKQQSYILPSQKINTLKKLHFLLAGVTAHTKNQRPLFSFSLKVCFMLHFLPWPEQAGILLPQIPFSFFGMLEFGSGIFWKDEIDCARPGICSTVSVDSVPSVWFSFLFLSTGFLAISLSVLAEIRLWSGILLEWPVLGSKHAIQLICFPGLSSVHMEHIHSGESMDDPCCSHPSKLFLDGIFLEKDVHNTYMSMWQLQVHASACVCTHICINKHLSFSFINSEVSLKA